jgi:hypothetical protein
MAHRENRKQADKSPSGVSSIKKTRELPPSVRRFIKGSTIDISNASDFYRKRAEVATLLRDFVEPQPNSSYLLKNQFDRHFLVNLPLMLHLHVMRPADALADALFVLGREWAKRDFGNLPIATLPTDEFLRAQWEEGNAWDAFLRRDGCFGEIWWHSLGSDGKVTRWGGGCESGDFEVRVEFNFDATKPPKMLIGIKGKPAAILMNHWMTLTPNSPSKDSPGTKELREKSAALLDSIGATLKMDLRLIQPEKGRPLEKFGERAAFLLDHEKRSLASIASELCQLPPNSTALARRQCFDRIRKAASNYYKLLRSDYTALTTVRVRQRLIRIPPNPNAVKSE